LKKGDERSQKKFAKLKPGIRTQTQKKRVISQQRGWTTWLYLQTAEEGGGMNSGYRAKEEERVQKGNQTLRRSRTVAINVGHDGEGVGKTRECEEHIFKADPNSREPT